jgi:hypothetical protein
VNVGCSDGSYLGTVGEDVLNRELGVLEDDDKDLVTVNRKLLAK